MAAAANAEDVMDDDADDGDGGTLTRTELDTHANMPVVGKHSWILRDTGRNVEVNPFTPDCNAMRVPVVDAAVQYDCPM